uniref:Uncharacterized protein n=1 Tax=Arundo donax TaxID=35708 RepID=A0A0A9SMG4_ARUDO
MATAWSRNLIFLC